MHHLFLAKLQTNHLELRTQDFSILKMHFFFLHKPPQLCISLIYLLVHSEQIKWKATCSHVIFLQPTQKFPSPALLKLRSSDNK